MREPSSSIDHKNEDPSDNRVKNLRKMRHELNLMRKGNATSGIRPNYCRFRFRKPMKTYINRHFTNAELSPELRDDFKYIKIEGKQNSEDNTQYTREGAVVHKREMALAVLEFLRKKDLSDLFKGQVVDVAKGGLLGGILKDIDMYEELVAQFKVKEEKIKPTKKKNKKKRKNESTMTSLFTPAQTYLHEETTTTTTTKKYKKI